MTRALGVGLLFLVGCASSQPSAPQPPVAPQPAAPQSAAPQPSAPQPAAPPLVALHEERDRHPCDESTQVHVESRAEAGAILLERHLTTGFCSTPTTRVEVLGRIVPSKPPSDRCPAGALVLRFQEHGESVELPDLVKSLDSDSESELRQHLYQFTGYGQTEVYLLGCPKPGRLDLVLVRTERADPNPRIELWVGNRVQTSDRRFVRPGK